MHINLCVLYMTESGRELGVGVVCMDLPQGQDAIFVEDIITGTTASQQNNLG